MTETRPTHAWKEIVTGFLKVGATAYGGPAIMGVMQAEFQERRQWVSKPRFLEGLALVNVLPGATATQLGIFLGYARAGWWGGLLAGFAFAVPGFVVMLTLALAYAALGVSPVVRGALYGLGPVVLGIFVVALYRLGRSAMRAWPHRCIAVAAALAALASPLGTVAILLLTGAVGLFLFHSRRIGAVVGVLLIVAIALLPLVVWSPVTPSGGAEQVPRLGRVVGLFATIGAFTFGGGLSMIALVEEHAVSRLHWLTPQEFIAGLALGQLTPGPVLMVAAYVGYKLLGVVGAVAAAAAAFLPSFVLMLAILPAFDRVRNLAWAKAVIQGIAPGVIGVMAVALARMAPPAVPDLLAVIVLLASVTALMLWQVGPLKAILAGAVVGIVRSRVCELPGVRAVLCVAPWGR
jgi:chromate transporter